MAIFSSLTKVPLVLSRSFKIKVVATGSIRAWLPETAGLSMTISLLCLRPIVKGCLSAIGYSRILTSLKQRVIFGITSTPGSEQMR